MTDSYYYPIAYQLDIMVYENGNLNFIKISNTRDFALLIIPALWMFTLVNESWITI